MKYAYELCLYKPTNNSFAKHSIVPVAKDTFTASGNGTGDITVHISITLFLIKKNKPPCGMLEARTTGKPEYKSLILFITAVIDKFTFIFVGIFPSTSLVIILDFFLVICFLVLIVSTLCNKTSFETSPIIPAKTSFCNR